METAPIIQASANPLIDPIEFISIEKGKIDSLKMEILQLTTQLQAKQKELEQAELYFENSSNLRQLLLLHFNVL
jgi:hypothetical protein